MELGIGMFGDVSLDTKTGKYRDASVKLNEILEQVKLMDQVGLDVFAMGEHHRADVLRRLEQAGAFGDRRPAG